jgi:hypothetical protein
MEFYILNRLIIVNCFLPYYIKYHMESRNKLIDLT